MFKLFGKTSPELTTVSIDSKNISCAWFSGQKKNKFILRDYDRITLDDLSIYNLNIYNPINFKDFLQKFLSKNKIENSFIYLSLSGNEIIETVFYEDIKINQYDNNSQTYSSNFYKINQKDFYHVKFNHSLIFQYKLFFIQSRLNLAKLIPGSIALINIINLYNPRLLKNILEINDIKSNFYDFIDSCKVENYIMNSDFKINIKEEKEFIFNNLGIYLLKTFS